MPYTPVPSMPCRRYWWNTTFRVKNIEISIIDDNTIILSNRHLMNCFRSNISFDITILTQFVMVVLPINIVIISSFFLFLFLFLVHKYTYSMKKNCEKAKWSGVKDIRSVYAIPQNSTESIIDKNSFKPMYSLKILFSSTVSVINIIISIMAMKKFAQLLPAMDDRM